MLSLTRGTTLAERAMVPRNGPAAVCSTVAIPAEKGPPFLKQRGRDFWHPQPEMWSLHLLPEMGYLFQLVCSLTYRPHGL